MLLPGEWATNSSFLTRAAGQHVSTIVPGGGSAAGYDAATRELRGGGALERYAMPAAQRRPSVLPPWRRTRYNVLGAPSRIGGAAPCVLC